MRTERQRQIFNEAISRKGMRTTDFTAGAEWADQNPPAVREHDPECVVDPDTMTYRRAIIQGEHFKICGACMAKVAMLPYLKSSKS